MNKNDNKDLKILKKYYGEDFAILCRDLFPSILETEGLLSKTILSKFAPNNNLYNDIMEQNKKFKEDDKTNSSTEKFENYIYSLVPIKYKKEKSNKTVRELLAEKDYDFYECKTEEDIQKFRKYYEKDEELCTFQGGRLKRSYVFFAIKKDVDKIKREKIPTRESDYGRSVISIQFTKQGNYLIITNRYNQHVLNPNATFYGNLEEINIGLTDAFEKEYGLKLNQNPDFKYGFNLDNYILASDGKWYRYNYKINNIYYCPNNNIFDNGTPKQIDTSRYILIDYFIVDLKEKIIILYDDEIKDSFVDDFNNIVKIEIHKEEKEKSINIRIPNKEDITIKMNSSNQIIELENKNITKIKDNYLYWNTSLTKLNTPNVETIRDWFMPNNKELRTIKLPKLTKIGDFFLISNEKANEVHIPKIKSLGNYILNKNEKISRLLYLQLKENKDEEIKNSKKR